MAEFPSEAKVKEVVTGILGLLVIIAVVYFSCNGCDSSPVKTQSKNGYISARDLQIQLKKVGYQFNEPEDLDTMQRLMSLSPMRDRTVWIFFRNDTVIEAQMTLKLEDNRESLTKNFEKFSDFTQAIDTSADSWIKNILKRHNPKQEIDSEGEINGRFCELQYLPDVNDDILNIYFKLK
jgi:hypothetical protein